MAGKRKGQPQGSGGGEDGERESAADVNARGNNARLSRIEEIGRTTDSRRADQLTDVDGERVVGEFADGEFDTPEARERAAAREEEEAAQAIRDAEDEARDNEQDEARRLQAEGAGEEDGEEGEEGGAHSEDDRNAQSEDPSDSDERVTDGVRYYRTIVNGQERWLTITELREGAATAGNAAETLQRAQEALQNASRSSLTPNGDEEQVEDKDLENIILSASTGDEEAVRKLATVIKGQRKGIEPGEVDRRVSQQIATQREVDRAEDAHKDLLKHGTLAPIFKQRLRELSEAKPKTKIADAFNEVAQQMRKDFAPMLQQQSRERPSKHERKRTIVNHPQSAGRQPRREEEDREVPVSEQIDQIAKARGQNRAHRIRRS